VLTATYKAQLKKKEYAAERAMAFYFAAIAKHIRNDASSISCLGVRRAIECYAAYIDGYRNLYPLAWP